MPNTRSDCSRTTVSWSASRLSLRLVAVVLGLLLALAGVGAMTVADGAAGGLGSWQGDLLAVAGAVLAAVYLRVGQSVRQRVGAGATMGLMCGTAAALLWTLSLGSGTVMLGFPSTTWGLLLLAVLP